MYSNMFSLKYRFKSLFVNMWAKLGTYIWHYRNGNFLGSYFRFCVKSFKKSYYTSNHIILCAQPTSASHPHLINHGDITRGLSAEVYDSRRNKLLKMIKENINDTNESYFHHLVIIPSSSVVYMSGHIPYPFRQFTEFNYLCGYNEANCVLILRTVMQRNDYESVLFIPKPTTTSVRWEGPKMSLEEVKNFLGVDKTSYTDELEKYLQSYAKSVERFTLWYDFSSSNSRLFNETMRSFIQAHLNYLSLESPKIFLHKSRLLKCTFETELMRKTCEIGAKSMREVIRFSEPFILESHLQAKMEYECRIRGADQPAFPPVVAGGSRANTIHYIENNQIVKDNEMVLMDAGCEFGGYCCDLARTWPVNGNFTDPQRKLYDLILSIQEHLIEICSEKPSLDYLFKIMCKELGKGLQHLGILPNYLSDDNVAKIAFEYCPHHVSHYLGMDVHDTDSISRGIKLLPGMVITIEPGIYILPNDLNVPEKYRGICIRIEDDVLITQDGVEVLTSACPKHADDIEKLMKDKT